VPLRGRGSNYTAARGVVEWTLARAYHRDWPARLVRRIGLQRRVRVRDHRIATPRWPAGAPPLRIAFASDLHAGPTTHPSVLDDAFAALAAAQADVVLLGGDYVFLTADRIDEIARRLAQLPRPRLGTFAVMGNHDLWADDAAIAAALSQAGARVLVNERVALPAPFAHVALVGLDDPWTGVRAEPAFLAEDAVRILLVHAPEAMLHLGDAPFDLALCGHTHGGHIALPGGVPILVPGPASRRFAHGRYDLSGGRTLIVSRGVGSTEVALRLNADPDILVVELGA
jgi:predicted MPP superfamily phosphohydrolase